MTMTPHKKPSRKSRRLALPFIALIALAGAVSPVAAATGFANMDQAAIAMIVAISTLLLAIVLEVWRGTLRTSTPIRNQAVDTWHQPKR